MEALTKLPAVTIEGAVFPTFRNERGEVVILDLDNARALQLTDPHAIRRLIVRWMKELRDFGPVSEQRSETSDSGGRPGIAYFLTEPQAMFVAAKCRTKAAAGQLKRLIDVYMAARQGNGAAAVALAQGSRHDGANPRFSGGDSPTDLLIANMQHALQLAQRFQRLESEQAQVSQRLALVENKQRTAAEEIEPISPAQPELPGISKRQLIREHVNRYAAAMGMNQQDAWRLLYHHVDRRLGTRVYSYVLAKGETKLDRLEKLGLLDKVGKVCDTELQIPAERLRQLAAPAQHSGVYHA